MTSFTTPLPASITANTTKVEQEEVEQETMDKVDLSIKPEYEFGKEPWRAEHNRLCELIPEDLTEEEVQALPLEHWTVHNRRLNEKNAVLKAEAERLEKEKLTNNKIKFKEDYAKWVAECKALAEHQQRTKDEWKAACLQRNEQVEAWEAYVVPFREAKDAAANVVKPKAPRKEDYL